MLKKILLSISICLYFSFQINAQEVLTLENAVKIAFENNYEIKIAATNLKINQNNVSLGNAGFLPQLTAAIVDNNGLQNISQTKADGTVSALNNAKNSNLTYGVSFGWMLFDGFKMFTTLQQLKTLEKQGETQLKLVLLSKLSEVNATYYNLVQQQQQLNALDSTLVISKQRLTLAQNRFSIGKASKLEVLNAQVDLNTDTTLLLKQKEQYAGTQILLNQILARDCKTVFSVQPTIQVDDQLDFKKLMELAQKQNPQLENQIIAKKIAELQLKQIKSGRYPNLALTSGYNFNTTHSSLGYTIQSSTSGLNYGFTASMNLFNGFYQNRTEKVAALQIENAQIAIDQMNKLLESQLSTTFQSYVTNLELLKLEKINEAIAKQNMDITLEKFKIGTITSIEFRTAQLNYINAKVRNSNSQLQAKLSEITLKELAGISSL